MVNLTVMAPPRASLPQRRRETSTTDCLDAILLVYHHPLSSNAPTIMEHVRAFEQHSAHPVLKVNTELGLPEALRNVRFRSIVLHYSLFGSRRYMLSDAWRHYLAASESSYKAAYFQDEYHACSQRFMFIDRYAIDTIFTLVEPRCFDQVYLKYTKAKHLVYNLPSYVSEDLPELASRFTRPDHERRIDIGYRGRVAYPFMGKGAAEKREIAEKFVHRARGLGLRLDIETAENRRIYGNHWYRFLGNCKAVLGVEAGVSIFDLDDQAKQACDDYCRDHKFATPEDLMEKVLPRWEDNVYYRTIGPRHFEAAALRACQILYEGDYSGVLKPMVHYIPLKKDFSNFEAAVAMYQDGSLRKELTDNTYRDLIASGRYTYRENIAQFDRELAAAGIEPRRTPETTAQLAALQESIRRSNRRMGAKLIVRAIPRRAWRMRTPLLARGRKILARTRRLIMAPLWVVGFGLGSVFGPLKRGFTRGKA